MLFPNKRINVVAFTMLTLIVASLASTDTASDLWYQNLMKSDLNPPGYVFGIVWPILYILMAITAYRNFNSIYKVFYIQLFFNAIWSWLFFSFHLTLIALFDIWILIFLNITIYLMVFKKDKFSSVLYLPYIIWLLFASYLNLYVVLNN